MNLSREQLDLKLFSQDVELVPIVPGTKKPIERFSLSSHWMQKRTTTADLAYWQSQNYDRAAVLGQVSDSLIGLDFDLLEDARKFLDLKLYESVPNRTLTTRTARGIRYLFKDPQCKFDRFKNSIDMRPQIAGEILLHHHLAHLPLNIHQSGFMYELVGTDQILSKPGCVDAFLAALRERFRWTGDPYKTEYSEIRASVKRRGKFDAKEIPIIVEKISPYWREGYRRKLVFALCGLLITNNANENNAISLINAIFDRTHERDQDRRNALAQVHVHFKHNSDLQKQPGVNYLAKVMKEVKQTA